MRSTWGKAFELAWWICIWPMRVLLIDQRARKFEIVPIQYRMIFLTIYSSNVYQCAQPLMVWQTFQTYFFLSCTHIHRTPSKALPQVDFSAMLSMKVVLYELERCFARKKGAIGPLFIFFFTLISPWCEKQSNEKIMNTQIYNAV